MTLLAKHLRDEGLSQKAFAVRIGCSTSYLNELLQGVKRPGLSLAVQIEDATKGAVPASSWVSHGPAPAPSQGRRRRAS